MSTQHTISLLNLDENDLNFDLDELDVCEDNILKNENNSLKSTHIQNKKRKSPSPNYLIMPSSKNSCIEKKTFMKNVNDKNNLKSDSIDKFETHNQSLSDLFDIQNDREITNDIYSSTQITQKLQNNPKNNFLMNQSSIFEQKLISSETFENSKLIDKIYAQNLCHDQVWVFAKDDINEQLNKHNINTNLLEKYSIKNCINKVYKYCLLKNEMNTKNEVFRIPFAYGRIARIDKITHSAVIFLQDDSDGIMCTISNSCTQKYINYIIIGTVLVIENACIIRLSSNKSSYHIIVDLNNLISVYYLNINEENENDNFNDNINKNITNFKKPIDVLKIKNLNINELNKNIKLFEKNLNNVDPLSILTKSSFLPISNSNLISNNKDSSLKSCNDSFINGNVNNNRLNHKFNYSLKTDKNLAFHTNKNNQTEENKNNSINSNEKISLIKIDNNQSNSRTFHFRNLKKSNDLNISRNSNEPKIKNTPLSQEVFSQLINGIEDELLKDD